MAEWSNGIMGCCGGPGGAGACCYVCCCYPCATGDIAEFIEPGAWCKGCFGSAVLMQFCSLSLCICDMPHRQQIGEKKGIEINFVENLLCSVCCSPCAKVQVYSEMQLMQAAGAKNLSDVAPGQQTMGAAEAAAYPSENEDANWAEKKDEALENLENAGEKPAEES